MELISGLIGALFGAFVLIFISAIIFTLWLLNAMQKKYKVKITNVSEGKPTIHSFDAKLDNHETLGQVLKSSHFKGFTGCDYISYLGNSSVYPLSSGGFAKYFVPLSFRNGAFAPEKYDPLVEEEVTKIVTTKLVDGKMHYDLIKEKVQTYVTRPIKASMRSFILKQTLEIGKDYPLELSFWQRWGSIAFAILLVFIGVAVLVLLTVFGMQSMEKQMNAPLLSDQISQRTVELIRQTQNQTTEQGVPVNTLPNPLDFQPTG